ncbi:MAG TPA: adenylate/guanylate cyclase domain-containing protein [Candidatus Binatia bacterium]|nr:adenylate/guanylate cyclase domain-containing protein [Candidatus Binatia bacterium]
MTFDEILTQVVELLQHQGRVSYGALKRRFALDDDYLQDLKDELITAQRVAADEDGKVLVWVGDVTVPSSPLPVASSSQPPTPQTADSGLRTPDSGPFSGERRQLTVMFCDMVGSTALSERLDPEELREVVQRYQVACEEVIHRLDGYVARYVGDALLVYFGYPVAHEDDAQRAVRTGVEIVGAMQDLPRRLNIPLPQPLQVRIGIHSGLVVVGEMGGRDYRESMALGDTPNIASRVQGLAEPDTVVISSVTYRLVAGLFECQDLGPHSLKGISTPMQVYRVVRESEAQSRFEVAVRTGLTPLIGREHEVGLLQERWERAKQGDGQAVLLSGEAGIGKSRLVQELKEHVITEDATRIEFRCSPYHQNSAFYPIIEHLQRLLQFAPHDTPQAKLAKLQETLAAYRFPQADTLPLLAALLSLPHPEGTPPLMLSPQKQKQKTQEALVAWIIEEAEKAAVFCAWEDLHWTDPSTLEVLSLFLEQIPTARVFTVLTCRPDFTPPWGSRSYLTQLTLNRLGRQHVETMVEKVTGGKALPSEVVQQIVAKTDGVPLFVEELTKMVLESELLREEKGRYVGAHGGAPIPPLAIPSTLQDSLMARLDRLAPVREIAQMGAALGREFSYEVLHAISPLDEALLQQGLRQLVEAELIYQRGLPPQASYLFKHALVQDTAYQSLLKSKRQQYHSQIAQVLEERFTEIKETQPELLAHHYTEAGLIAQAIPYWQKAGQRATRRSANVEAIAHLTKGLELLKTLPDTPERTQQELTLQVALGAPLQATKGFAAPEAEKAHTRARELCRQVGESPQLFPVLWGLWLYYNFRGGPQTARELGQQLLTLAQNAQDSSLLLQAHHTLWTTSFWLGELVPARAHAEQGMALYDPQQHRSHAVLYGGHDPGVCCRFHAAWALWLLGYPDQALKRSHEAITLAQDLSHPTSLAAALLAAAELHQFRREGQAAQERAEAVITASTEQGLAQFLAWATVLQGWALAEQERGEEEIAKMRQGMAAYWATGAETVRAYFLALLAEACGKKGQAEEGLTILAEALAVVNRTGERLYEAELYRLKGELTLQQSKVQGPKSKVEAEAKECFWKAIDIARRQSAKSLELRAVTSLSRLWQKQDKKKEAHEMLAEVYGWFTEGFDTADLKEAKELLEELER